MAKKVQFLAGLFLVCMCVLMLQIVETRILSVISFYHLAFFAISMAMFGMTAGSLIVYFYPRFFAPERPGEGFFAGGAVVEQGDCRACSALSVRRDGDLAGADA